MTEITQRFIYDYKQLDYFHIDPDKVSSSGTIVNEPYWEKYKYPVSYTHLDVYKRQDMDREIPKEIRQKERNKKIIRYSSIGVASIVVIGVLISVLRAGVEMCIRDSINVVCRKNRDDWSVHP